MTPTPKGTRYAASKELLRAGIVWFPDGSIWERLNILERWVAKSRPGEKKCTCETDEP